MKISVASGGFDPLHSGHIQYLKASAKIGDHLVVALNSDDWLIAKKGKNFLPFTERKLILEHMEMVDEVCLLYTSPSPRDLSTSRMPSSA